MKLNQLHELLGILERYDADMNEWICADHDVVYLIAKDEWDKIKTKMPPEVQHHITEELGCYEDTEIGGLAAFT